MFKNKKTKQQSINVVDSLLSNYLQVSDKKLVKGKEKGNKEHVASKILEVNSKLGNFKKTKDSLKKYKQRERKLRNKEMKKVEKINEKIIRQSKIDNGDKGIIQEIVDDKLKNLKRLDMVNKDEDLLDLQNDILNLTKVDNTKTKLKQLRSSKYLEAKKRREDEMLFNDNVAKGTIKVGGVTPGLALPGADDSDSEDFDDDDDESGGANNLANFKDDFDDFN